MLTIAIIAFVNSSVVLGQTKAKNPSLGYADASYSGLSDSEFLKNWLILGPVRVDTSAKPTDPMQKAFFDKDLVTTVLVQPNKALPKLKIGNEEYAWKPVKSENSTIDLIALFGQKDYVAAYALAEIKMEAPAKVMIGLGSDDGVKLFLNGTLVHENWTGRGVNADDDIVFLDLKKGSNQILLKVQNMELGWGFTIRKLGKDNMNKQLVESASRGNLDNVKLLLENGADVNAQNEAGLTAYQSATIKGRERVLDYLKSKGAKTDLPMPELDKFVGQLFKSEQTGNMPGVSVLVARDGNIIYEKGFGYADIGNKVPVTSDTKFRIGSITKQFVASAILKLQEEGKLSVQDKLSKFIPDFPRGDEVTLHHLLTHTSGVHSYTSQPNFIKYVTLPIAEKSLVDSIKTYTFDFNPGDRYSYSNSGYFLLGYIVEKISGKSLAEYLNDTFFKPLGMNSTGIYDSNTILSNEAYGYSYENGKQIKAINWDMTWAGGAGAIYSTVKDLYTWNEAIFNGKVLSEQSLKAAFTPAELNNKEKSNYGYGWGLADYRGIKFISHSGGLNGFLTFLERQPERKVTVVVFCNSTPMPDGSNPTSSGLEITDYVLWQNLAGQSSFASDVKVDENTLKRYVGRYDYSQGAVLIVTLDGKQLYAQMTRQAGFPIFPSSKEEFYWKVVEARIKFVMDDAGNVTGAVHYQNGQELKVKRLKDEVPVAVNPAVFNKYIGKYDLGNQFFLEIIREGDKLMIIAPNMPKYELLPASETEYFLREMTARLAFKVNSEGNKTEALDLSIDGSIKTAKKVTE